MHQALEGIPHFWENALLIQLEVAKARALVLMGKTSQTRTMTSDPPTCPGQWISRNLGGHLFVSSFISSLEPAGSFPVALWCVSS